MKDLRAELEEIWGMRYSDWSEEFDATLDLIAKLTTEADRGARIKELNEIPLEPNFLPEYIAFRLEYLNDTDSYPIISKDEVYAEDFDFAWDSLKLNVQELISKVIGDENRMKPVPTKYQNAYDAREELRTKQRERAKLLLTKLNGGK